MVVRGTLTAHSRAQVRGNAYFAQFIRHIRSSERQPHLPPPDDLGLGAGAGLAAAAGEGLEEVLGLLVVTFFLVLGAVSVCSDPVAGGLASDSAAVAAGVGSGAGAGAAMGAEVTAGAGGATGCSSLPPKVTIAATATAAMMMLTPMMRPVLLRLGAGMEPLAPP